MATVRKWKYADTPVTLLSTELNTALAGTGYLSSVGGTSGVFTNLDGGGTDKLYGYTSGKFELVLATGNTISNEGAVIVWFIKQMDGTNYEDGSSSVLPKRAPDVTFFPRNVTTAQRIVVEAPMPAGVWKVLYYMTNLGAAAQLASSGNTLKVLAVTDGQV